MPEIDANTRVCAVIGHPVGHTLSPAIHNAAFKALQLNWVYLAHDIELLHPFLQGMRATPGFRGLSVTIPHKLAVMEYLDEVEPMAQKIGSVNTVTNIEGKLVGSSTDGLGTLRAFENAGVSLHGKNVLLLGAGGAVRAVAFAVAQEAQANALTILARNEAKVNDLADDLRQKTGATVHTGQITRDIQSALTQNTILIQGTSVGMAPESVGETLVPPKHLEAAHVVFDMVYRPQETQLIQDANAAGCTVIHGIEMLLHQAALQFEKWTGQDAPLEAMRAAAMHHLQHRDT